MSYHDYLIQVFKHGKHVYGDEFKIKNHQNGKVEIVCGKRRSYNGESSTYDNSVTLSYNLYKDLMIILHNNIEFAAQETINEAYWYSHNEVVVGDKLFKEMSV